MQQTQPAKDDLRLSDPDFQASVVSRRIASVIATAVLVAAWGAHDAWVAAHPPGNEYFESDPAVALAPVVPLDKANMDEDDLLQWTVSSVLAAYHVNWYDYPAQLNAAGRHFTTAGWGSFARSYIRLGNFDKMRSDQMLCYSAVQRAGVIRSATVTAGRLTYEVELPVVHRCSNHIIHNEEKLDVTATVVRTDAADHNHPDGIAIDRLVAKQL